MLPCLSLLGFGLLLGLCVLLSRNRQSISWRLVGFAVLLQSLFAGALAKCMTACMACFVAGLG